jgi:hypothetical protein
MKLWEWSGETLGPGAMAQAVRQGERGMSLHLGSCSSERGRVSSSATESLVVTNLPAESL